MQANIATSRSSGKRSSATGQQDTSTTSGLMSTTSGELLDDGTKLLELKSKNRKCEITFNWVGLRSGAYMYLASTGRNRSREETRILRPQRLKPIYCGHFFLLLLTYNMSAKCRDVVTSIVSREIASTMYPP